MMNYEKLIKDFKSGKLKERNVRLVMDNDCSYFDFDQDGMTEAQIDKYRAKLDKEYGESNGYSDIVDVLIAAGVNCEWC